MNRRQFLSAVASPAVAPAAAAGPSQIIDTHTHFYDPSRKGGVPWPRPEEKKLYRTVLPPEFMALTQPLGVRGTVVVEASPWLEDNQWILDLAHRYPVIVGFIGHLEPGRPEFRNHLEGFVKNPIFRGIRLGGGDLVKGLGDPAFLEDMRRMGGAGLTLDAIGGPEMLAAAERLAGEVPSLRIVLDHLPLDPFANKGDEAAYRDGLQRLAGRSNVWVKVSGVLRRDAGQAGATVRMDRLWRTFGADRLIYASNWPVSDLAAPYREILSIVSTYFTAKGPEAAEKFFWKNSLEAYRLSRYRG